MTVNWEEIYNRFNPDEPALRPDWRADRQKYGPTQQLITNLKRPFGERRFLFLGTVGTGKTTELLKVAEAQADRDFVVFLDLVRHFGEVVCDMEALQHVASWEVCFLAGLALMRAAEEQLGHVWDTALVEHFQQSWKELSETTETSNLGQSGTFDAARLAQAMILLVSQATAAVPTPEAIATGAAAATGLAILNAATKATSWKIPIGLPGRKKLPDQHSAMQKLLHSVNRIIGTLQNTYSRRVLLVVDGLDRITDFTHVHSLFLESELLGQLACSLVVCGPFALRHSIALGNLRRLEQCTLVNVPVLKQETPNAHGAGVEFFCDLFNRRTADMSPNTWIGRAELELLAYYSGGRARDFVRSVRMLSMHAYDASAERATFELVEQTLDEARRLRENGIHKGHIDLLTQIMEDPEHRLPKDELALDLLVVQRHFDSA